MATNRRKSSRQAVTRTVLIEVDGGPNRLQPCQLVDVSETGSQLLLLSADALPAEFTLVLSHGGRVKRRCQVAWQVGKKVGVRFIAAADTPAATPNARSEHPAPASAEPPTP
jgi:hypothetical protein